MAVARGLWSRQVWELRWSCSRGMQTSCSQTLFNGSPRSHLIAHFRLPSKRLYFAFYCGLLWEKICHWDNVYVPENSRAIFAPTVEILGGLWRCRMASLLAHLVWGCKWCIHDSSSVTINLRSLLTASAIVPALGLKKVNTE